VIEVRSQTEPLGNTDLQEKEDGEWMMTDHTEAGMNNFNIDLNWYKIKETTYLAEITTLGKVTQYIQATVDKDYAATFCVANEEIW
jgi:hypothetical protein